MSFVLLETITQHDGSRNATCLALYETIKDAKQGLSRVNAAHRQCPGVCDCIQTSTFAQIEFADDQDHHTTICLRVKQA